MAASLSELTVQVLTQRMAKKEMTLEEIQKEMVAISNMIKAIDEGTITETTETPAEAKPEKINMRKVFKDKEVVCLICNKGFTTLKRHLTLAHQITEKDYKKQFGIPAKQKLVAKSYSEERRKAANERGLADVLAKARAARVAKKAEAPKAAKKK